MNPIVLYRSILFEKEELEAASESFNCVNSILKIPKESLVIARYSVLPFYDDVERDIQLRKSKLLNSFHQYRFISDLGNYTEALGSLTPKTYYPLETIPENGGPFVLKGETNSRRNLWKTHMFARNKKEAIEVASRLMNDGLVGQQKIYTRDYIPLESFMTGLDGVPVAREFRFFVLDRQILTGGFYWSSHIDTLRDIGVSIPQASEVPQEFLQKVIDAIGENSRFYAIDVAKTRSGDWIVIELNDGQMAGLSDNDPRVFYRRIKKVLNDEKI